MSNDIKIAEKKFIQMSRQFAGMKVHKRIDQNINMFKQFIQALLRNYREEGLLFIEYIYKQGFDRMFIYLLFLSYRKKNNVRARQYAHFNRKKYNYEKDIIYLPLHEYSIDENCVISS